MTAVAFSPFDVMEAPEWSEQRSTPPIEIASQILDAPPVRRSLLHPAERMIPPTRRRSLETMVLPNKPVAKTKRTADIIREIKGSSLAVVKPTIESFEPNEEIWFQRQDVLHSATIPSDRPPTRPSPFYWLGAVLSVTLICVAWASIAVLLFHEFL